MSALLVNVNLLYKFVTLNRIKEYFVQDIFYKDFN